VLGCHERFTRHEAWAEKPREIVSARVLRSERLPQRHISSRIDRIFGAHSSLDGGTSAKCYPGDGGCFPRGSAQYHKTRPAALDNRV